MALFCLVSALGFQLNGAWDSTPLARDAPALGRPHPGRTLCTPHPPISSPRCTACGVADECAGHEHGEWRAIGGEWRGGGRPRAGPELRQL
eukprot:scaffold10985_cov69-Phaeocystis_antarctica.AAC.2